MSAQEPFHHFASRAGGGALLAIDLVPLVHYDDLLAEIVVLFRVGTGPNGLRLAHGIRLRLRRGSGK
jgi:hypothetical protein